MSTDAYPRGRKRKGMSITLDNLIRQFFLSFFLLFNLTELILSIAGLTQRLSRLCGKGPMRKKVEESSSNDDVDGKKSRSCNEP